MKVIFVFAHPDDESFSSAGTIAKLTQKGVNVKLITATKGEAGQIGNPPLCKRKELGIVREKELRSAAKILGISQIYFLDYIDGTLNDTSIMKIGTKILEILKKEKPDIVVTFNKEGGSRHPDHVRIHKAATFAFKKYIRNINKTIRLYYAATPRSFIKKLKDLGIMYKAFGEIKGMPVSQITTVVDISDTVGKKMKALKSHKTQRQDWERYLRRIGHEEFKFEFFKLAVENNLI